MKRIVCLMSLLIVGVAAWAQKGQDFASRFMQICDGDTAVHCVTVSPKMMEQLTKQPDMTGRNEHIAQAIQKLKSARIITTSVHGEGYYQEATQLLKRNAQRFQPTKSYKNEHSYGSFYTRKLKSGRTVELILLHTDTKARQLVIVNLTGDIDEEFINSLSKNFSGKTARLTRY